MLAYNAGTSVIAVCCIVPSLNFKFAFLRCKLRSSVTVTCVVLPKISTFAPEIMPLANMSAPTTKSLLTVNPLLAITSSPDNVITMLLADLIRPPLIFTFPVTLTSLPSSAIATPVVDDIPPLTVILLKVAAPPNDNLFTLKVPSGYNMATAELAAKNTALSLCNIAFPPWTLTPPSYGNLFKPGAPSG